MYQCYKENFEDSAKGNQGYTFPWEYRADAQLTFDKNGNKSIVHCYFTSVFIDDIELVNKGLDEDSIVEKITTAVGELSVRENIQMAENEATISNDKVKAEASDKQWDVANKFSTSVEEEQKPNDKEELEVYNLLDNDIAFSNWKQFSGYDQTDKHNENQKKNIQVAEVEDKEQLQRVTEQWKQRKRAQKFAEEIRQLQYAPGFNFDPYPEDDCDLGCLDEVNYEAYPSTIDVNRHFKELRRKRKMSSRSRSPATTSSLIKSSSMENEEIVEDEIFVDKELSEDEKLQFKFAYDPVRDRQLLARLSKKYLVKDKEMVKYWSQRYRYFNLLDKGILMDKQCWFSVTPEFLAKHMAERLVPIKDCTILDPFTGSGCNSIQFALRGAFVFAFDLDPIKLLCANQNAKIYGASHRINFICGDFFNIALSMMGAMEAKQNKRTEENGKPDQFDDPCPSGIDAIYLSPPWGGPSYSSTNLAEFDIRKDMDLDGFKIFETAKRITENIVYFLPRNSSVNQLIELAGRNRKVELEQSIMNGKVKALHAYYGQLVSK